MEKGRRDTVLLTVIAIATLLVAIVGATFAFFTARITNNDSTSTLTITSASGVTVTFVGGDPITVENIYPRGENNSNPWVTKQFKVTYDSAGATTGYLYTYQLYLDYTNTFGANEIRYDIVKSDGYCANPQESSSTCTGWTANTNNGTQATATDGRFAVHTTEYEQLIGTSTFVAGTTSAVHTYTLTISYPDTNVNQNFTGNETNQGKSLTARIWIKEVPNNQA